MRRFVFKLPPSSEISQGWARVRDEGDKISLSIKSVGTKIEEQKELQLIVNDFEIAAELMRALGCSEKAYQESRRELWRLDGVDITIDEWPFLEPFIEVEGETEQAVRLVSEKLGLEWNSALFCAVGTLYAKKYGITEEVINDRVSRLSFVDTAPPAEFNA